MKTFKKSMAIILSILMLVSVMTVAGISAFAADYSTYSLIGYIDGADVGKGDDYQNVPNVFAEDGTQTLTFAKDSYVFVKTTDNNNWFMFEQYCQDTTGTLKNTSTGTKETMFVPAGTVTFTLVENGDGTLTLSYVTVKESEDTTASETESQDTTASETESQDTTASETESQETTPSETEASEASSETEASEASSETEASEASSETEAQETTPSETESQETTASETESQETTPSETESQETTASETESQETTPSETEPAPVFDYYVVGSPELFGANWAEDPANGMTKGDDGNYYLTIENAPAGSFGFKVKDSNGGWHPEGMGNDGAVTTVGGEKVIFCYNPDAGVAIVSTDGQVPTYPVPTKPTETEATQPTETEPTQPTEPVCDHSKTTTTGKKAATYFEKGYTGDTVCADCGEVVAKGSAVAKKVLKTPKVTVKTAKKAIKVTYKKVKDAKGFVVTYKLGKKTYNEKFTLSKKELKKAKVTKTIKVKKTGKYKVTVKAFVKSGKKVAYSDPTKAATAKVK